ncbi:MAG: hypothetical protein ACLSAF_22360 [Intestinimonas sp.]
MRLRYGQVNPSSLIMIHKCWTFLWGGYNADELREQATQQDAWDKMQMEVYTRKTGLSATVISHDGGHDLHDRPRSHRKRALRTRLIEDAEPTSIAASVDGRSLFVNSRKMHLAPGMFAPDNIPTVTPEASAPVETDKKQPEVTGNEGGISMTLEELRAKYPDRIAWSGGRRPCFRRSHRCGQHRDPGRTCAYAGDRRDFRPARRDGRAACQVRR